MKITFRLIVSLLAGTALVVLAFSYVSAQKEENRLDEELRLRASVLAKTFKEAIEPFLERTEQPSRIRTFIGKFAGHKRLIGLIVDLKDSEPITLPLELGQRHLFQKECLEVIEKGETVEFDGKWDSQEILFHAIPIEKEDAVVGALALIHDRSFIVRRMREFWRSTAATFFALALILSATSLFIIRLNVTGPLSRIKDLVTKSTFGEIPPPAPRLTPKGEMEDLVYAVTHMASSLKSARIDLAQQSRVIHAQGTVWSKERLKDYLHIKLKGKPIFAVANREPYIHRKANGGIECITPASGVVTALDPVLQATGGVWVAHGAGNADRLTVDSGSKVKVPPDSPSYTLKRVWLDQEEEQGYYYGFSNEGLWPLCHISHMRPIFRAADWEQYQKVNQKFADALLAELPDEAPLILIQDYHFALLPRMIKQRRPDAKVALFWHIPWPNPEAFGICPWQEDILEGMLGSDLIGFHTQFHCNNFLDTVDRALEARIDWTSFGVIRGGKTSYVRPLPISIADEPDRPDEASRQAFLELKRKLNLQGKKVGVGVDRIDYTKGLIERFRAIERTLEKYPQYKGELVFVELGAPSRTLIPSYQNHLREIEELVESINQKFQQGNYRPIVFLKDHHHQEKIREFYRLADFCLVSSLHDGMNLVAKEFVTSRMDEDGVLILSRFAGASQEFKDALLINPYDIEGTADALHQALTMHPEEKKERMTRLRTVVREYNIYRWAAELITELIKSC